MGFSFLEQNAARVRGMTLGGVVPTYQTISTYQYPGARPLYLYVKGEHVGVIPGLKEFLAEYSRAGATMAIWCSAA
jgi:phosphate transport system substrate-binding protein